MSNNTNQFKRSIDPNLKNNLSEVGNSLFNMNTTNETIGKIEEEFLKIENGIKGRIAGDIEDYVLSYLIAQWSAKNLSSTDENLTHVEIGSLFGGSLINTLNAHRSVDKSLKLIAIDPLNGYYINEKNKGDKLDIATKLPVDKETLIGNLNAFSYNDNDVDVWQDFSTSKAIHEKAQILKIACLFIDGDHSYEGIKNDWDVFSPKVIDKGICIIDNYLDHQWPGVSKFVHEELLPKFNNWKVLLVLNRTIVLQKSSSKSDSQKLLEFCVDQCYQRRVEGMDWMELCNEQRTTWRENKAEVLNQDISSTKTELENTKKELIDIQAELNYLKTKHNEAMRPRNKARSLVKDVVFYFTKKQSSN